MACRSICTGKGGLISQNAIFLNYYYKKIEDGKTKRQVLTCVMRRIINIIYNILSKNEEYKHPKELNDEYLSNYQEKLEQEKEEKTKKNRKIMV